MEKDSTDGFLTKPVTYVEAPEDGVIFRVTRLPDGGLMAEILDEETGQFFRGKGNLAKALFYGREVFPEEVARRVSSSESH